MVERIGFQLNYTLTHERASEAHKIFFPNSTQPIRFEIIVWIELIVKETTKEIHSHLFNWMKMFTFNCFIIQLRNQLLHLRIVVCVKLDSISYCYYYVLSVRSDFLSTQHLITKEISENIKKKIISLGAACFGRNWK